MKNTTNTRLLLKLRERIKELNCLFDLSKLVEQPSISLEKILKGTINLLPSSLQYPRITCARAMYLNNEFKTRNFKTTQWRLSAKIKAFGKKEGFIEVCYTRKMRKCHEGPFLKEERALVDAVAKQLSKIIERKSIENTLKKSRQELWKQKISLERKNIALREVIEQIGVEKNNIKNEISANVYEILLPILGKLRIKKERSKHIDLLEYHLKEITSPFGDKISARHTGLTSREIEICSMIKGNLTSKEIAGLLNLSSQTIETHRKNIRKKLRVPDKKNELSAFLHHF